MALLKELFHKDTGKELFHINTYKITSSKILFDMFFDQSNNKLIFDFNLDNVENISGHKEVEFSLKNSFEKDDILFLNTCSDVEHIISNNNFSFSPLLNASLLKGHLNSFNLNRLNLFI